MAKTAQNEIKIRGLSEHEINYLKALAKEDKAKSFNQFMLDVIREKIEKRKFNSAESLYLAYLEDMKLAAQHAAFLTEKHEGLLDDFEKKMDRYGYHIARWLEYEGEVERDD